MTGFGSRAAFGELHDVADLVDDQAEAFAAHLGANRHRRLAAFERRQAETAAHVDGGDDATAQVQDPGDLARGERHAGQPIGDEDVLHAVDGQAEQLGRRS